MIPRYHLIHLNQMILGICKTTKPPMFPVAVLVSLAVRAQRERLHLFRTFNNKCKYHQLSFEIF